MAFMSNASSSASANSRLIALISQLKGVHIGTGTSTRASSRKRKKHDPCAWACVYACIEAILWRSKSGTIMLAWCLWKPCLILLIRLPGLVTVMMFWTLLILAECSMHVTYMYDPSSGLQHKSPFSVAQ